MSPSVYKDECNRIITKSGKKKLKKIIKSFFSLLLYKSLFLISSIFEILLKILLPEKMPNINNMR